jgi:hypothetical protein
MRTAAAPTLLLSLMIAASAPAAEIIRLTAENFDAVAPRGKEADAVIGDWVLRNDRVVAVIADPVAGRDVNLTVRDAGGALIDFTFRDPGRQNDHLTAFLPGGGEFRFRRVKALPVINGEAELQVMTDPDAPSPLRVSTSYRLVDGEDRLRVTTAVANAGVRDPAKPEAGVLFVRLADRLRCDGSFAFAPAGDERLFWAYDRHFHAAYGVEMAGGLLHTDPKDAEKWRGLTGPLLHWRPLAELKERPADPKETAKLPTGEMPRPPDRTGYAVLKPGESLSVTRFVHLGRHQAEVQGAFLRADTQRDLTGGRPIHTASLTVQDKAGKPVAGAEVDVFRDGEAPEPEAADDTPEPLTKDGARPPVYVPPAPKKGGKDGKDAKDKDSALPESAKPARPFALAHTDAEGRVALPLPAGKYVVRLRDPGRPTMAVPLPLWSDGEPAVTMENAAAVRLVIVGDDGKPCPAKIRFDGVGRTRTPDFGPDDAVFGVRNLVYAPYGEALRPVAPGTYNLLFTRGPEFDAVPRSVVVRAGKTVEVRVRMHRSVDTAGWVSADLHNHSTESGDNTADIGGRIVNLICEGVEFAPCTEHNRVHSYRPHLARLGLAHLLATSDGLELTGRPLPLNHQNAFPLVFKPHRQSGGGPATDPDPEVQIARLLGWDGGADKVVQINHPDLGWMAFDRDGDGKPDAGYPSMFKNAHVIECFEPDALGGVALLERTYQGKRYVVNNRVFNWLQLLNRGVRVYSAANTDAHINFHGSGHLRNWVRSSSDDPAKVSEKEMVAAFKGGRFVMSNGPFLEVQVRGERETAGPGDDIHLPGGEGRVWVKVQCPNWLDVNRVAVLVNGRAEPSLDFTRASHPGLFGDGPVKFEWTVPLKLTADAHIIVVATGEGLSTGPAFGDRDDPPTAISNPVFVSLNGKTFTPSGDTLGKPLPVRLAP